MRNKGSDMGVRAVERKEKADQSYYCAEGMDRPGLGLELWKFISLRNNKHCSEKSTCTKNHLRSQYVCVCIYIYNKTNKITTAIAAGRSFKPVEAVKDKRTRPCGLLLLLPQQMPSSDIPTNGSPQLCTHCRGGCSTCW